MLNLAQYFFPSQNPHHNLGQNGGALTKVKHRHHTARLWIIRKSIKIHGFVSCIFFLNYKFRSGTHIKQINQKFPLLLKYN